MDALKTIYDAELVVLAPLHIGTGRTLARGYDYAVFDRRTWRINEDRLFEGVYVASQGNGDALNRLLMGRPAEELLAPADYREHPEFFRYQMPGAPRAVGPGAELRECLKNVYDRPYIPGSSLKGALRTVLAWAIFRGERMQLNVRKLGDSRSWAGQPVEREIFGADPNRDLLRSLQVGDSDPVGSEALMLANVQVVAGNRFQSPIEVEALKPETRLQLTLTLDEYLLSAEIARRLGWRNRGDYLRQLARHSRDLALLRCQAERTYCGRWPELARVAAFYDQLIGLGSRLKEDDLLVQMSWGAGWGAKTLGSCLSDNPAQLEEIIADFRLSKSRQRKTGDPFPRSRRLAFDGRGPAVPLGWAWIRMKRRAA